MNQPQLYSENNDLQIRTNISVLEKFIKRIKFRNNSETVLDVGVGDGKFSVEYLIPRLPGGFMKFVGCDISESMLTYAKNKYKIPNVDFKQLDIETDTIPDEFLESFNHVFSFFALHWTNDLRKALMNIHKILRPGGDMLLTYAIKSRFNLAYENLSQRPKWKNYDHSKLYIPELEANAHKREVETFLAEAGFCNISCDIQEKSYIFSTFDKYQSFMTSINPFILNMSLEERREYVVELMEELENVGGCKSKIIEGKKVFENTYTIFVICASKRI